jgi:hypothetical protein
MLLHTTLDTTNESTDRSFLIIFRVENLGACTARFYRIQPGP